MAVLVRSTPSSAPMRCQPIQFSHAGGFHRGDEIVDAADRMQGAHLRQPAQRAFYRLAQRGAATIITSARTWAVLWTAPVRTL